MARGSIDKRVGRTGTVSYRLRVYVGYDPETRKSTYKTKTVKGTLREAETELRRLLIEVSDGPAFDEADATFAELLDRWAG